MLTSNRLRDEMGLEIYESFKSPRLISIIFPDYIACFRFLVLSSS